MKNYLTIDLKVITVRNGRVIFSESVWEYIKSWFFKGFELKLTDSSQYRKVKAVGIPLPIKKEIYA